MQANTEDKNWKVKIWEESAWFPMGNTSRNVVVWSGKN
jgi:hypothetical protein